MAKRNKKQQRRVKNLALVFTLTTIVLVTSTFAWFIGMRTVNVDEFDVTIAAVDGLSLSLDGATWSEKLSVTKEAANYEGNTNVWAEKGLVPMSTIGALDETSSTMKLFQKASLTKTDGGYRLLASRVNNYTATGEGENAKYNEGDGYVAFDLFIKNLSGEEYYIDNNTANEEAIYLTNDSSVKVSTSGGVAGTGIENSVRVAFAQIGRVIATTTNTTVIRGLNCTAKATEITDPTGICRTAQIWEPNDRNHVAGAIEYYNESCKTRTAEGYSDKSCKAITDGLAYSTYAISDVITYKEGENLLPVVDVYDGAEYNSYEGSTKLTAVDTFTDSEKLLAGTARQDFMTLAPNSITKVRVYVYIEGQDIDNYDLAQIGKKISVNFGFTKQRFNEDDINYTGDNTNEGDGPFVANGDGTYSQATDTTKPYIVLSGESITNGDTLTIAKGTDFSTLSITATAYDKVSTYTESEDETGNKTYTVATTANNTLTCEDAEKGGAGCVTKTGTVNTAVAGTYQVVYSVKDAAGNLGTKVLNVVVTE